MPRSLAISALMCTILIAIYSVTAYENAYDLLERRNQKFYESQSFRPKFYNDRRFFSQNRTPYRGETNQYFGEFGNNYNNIGNGITGHFTPLWQQSTRSWRFDGQPYRRRILNNFDFGYSTLRRPQQEYFQYQPEAFSPALFTSIPHGLYEDAYNLRSKTDSAKVDRFFEENEDKTQKKSDEFYQKNQGGAKTDSFKKEKSGEHHHSDQIGENKSSLRSKKVLKKGRKTTGFAVHHHKDETGNSTTFFDETSDFGGQSDLRDIADGFDLRKTLEQISHKGDEKYFTEMEEKSGNYGSGLLKGNQRFEKDSSSSGNREESEWQFDGNGNDNPASRTYKYLNSDAFDYSKPDIDNY